MSRVLRVSVAVLLAAAVLAAGTTAVTLAAVDGRSTGNLTADRPPGAAVGQTATAFAGNEPGSAGSRPRIVAVYPDPVTDGDRGEFVVVAVPPGTSLGQYTLTDGEDRIDLPDATAGGRVVLTGEPDLVRNLTGNGTRGRGQKPARVHALPGSLSLANGGERIELLSGNETLADARFRDAPEGTVGRYDSRRTLTWEPLGRTDRPVVSAPGGTARVFVLPDAPDVPLSVLRSADHRIRLAGYTLTSRRVGKALVRASERGVNVSVLLEGRPVDGITRREARLLDRLVERGVTVRVVGGPRARYAYHHAKYAVVDDRAVVLTENWKPAGTGGASSRGWGVVVSQPTAVRALAETFRADAGWVDAVAWSEYRRGRSFVRGGVANATYPGQFDPATVPVEGTRVLVAPDNAGGAVVATLDGATDSVDVVQMTVDGPDQRFLRATVRAARRGVAVRILLSSAWYVREENSRLVEHLRKLSERENLALQAKLASPGDRFEKIHAKGVVVDGDEVVLGSLNWNGESVRNNREVLVHLVGEEVGAYYRRVFEADWGAGGPTLPVGLVAAALGCLLLVALVVRRIDFSGEEDVGVEG